MNCADFEILLCDYLDGTLAEAGRKTVESHIATCVSCAAMSEDVKSAVSFMERAAAANPPAELLTRILHEIPGRDLAEGNSFWRKLRSGWLGPLLQPRYAMGMAMTILSFSMLAKFAGFEPRQLRPSDLDPVKVWNTVDDRAHRTWDRAMKYYDNLRLVIEIQSRLKEWTDQEQAARRQSGSSQANQAPKSDGRVSTK
ncbi:MAG: anti-sigma factor family protein [Bryobacteraceae bacterium]